MIGIFKMVRRNTLVIRVDTNNKIGLGHFMRCRAFAQAWARQGGHCYPRHPETALYRNCALRCEGSVIVDHIWVTEVSF